MQYFYTKGATNTSVALYQLSIRKPNGSLSILPGYNFVFPLSPQLVRKTASPLTAIYDVQGTSKNLGVQRKVDEFGLAPPFFTIVGTTGWQFHSADGFLWTGQGACTRLQNLIDTYISLNQTIIQNQSGDPYTLEFYDFFRNEFWVVVPRGPIRIEQSADRPILSNYVLDLAAVKSVSYPYAAVAEDTVLNALALGQAAGASLAAATLANGMDYASSAISDAASSILAGVLPSESSISSSIGL